MNRAAATEPTKAQLAARKAAARRRERIQAKGRRIDLLLPPEAARALQGAAKPGETATATIVRLLLEAKPGVG